MYREVKVAVCFFVICSVLIVGAMVKRGEMLRNAVKPHQTVAVVQVDSIQPKHHKWDADLFAWEVFKCALRKVESGGNPLAVNAKTGARGLYQIMPSDSNGYLRDYNARQKWVVYTDDDLFRPEVQDEIFEYIQSVYNPKRDIYKALNIHNPKAGAGYYIEVYKEYERLIKKYTKEYNKVHNN